VTVTEDDGVFEETTGFDLGEEFCFGEKVVVASVDFAGTGRAGGGGDAVMPRTIRGSGATQGGLAASGGAGNNAEQAWQSGHRRWSHSMFCTCSRNFSTSHFPSTTRWAMAASLALAPMVLS